MENWPAQILDLAIRMRDTDHDGPLHILVADGNVEDEHIEFCRWQGDEDKRPITDEEKELCRELLEDTFVEHRYLMYWLSDYPDELERFRRMVMSDQ